MKYLEQLAQRRRFGMKPGLDTMLAVLDALGDPQRNFKAVHVAGTNGKGAVVSILDESFGAAGLKSGRYTSPHLVKLNERFFFRGESVDDGTLERISLKVEDAAKSLGEIASGLTFFEALTLVSFVLYAELGADVAVLETGLGGRLDATNVCDSALSVITRIGLDHCDWLGHTLEAVAAEKAGIIKPHTPVVLGANDSCVIEVVRRRAQELDAPFFYAPDIARESEIPESFALAGSFNRENAVTALAALKVVEERGIFPLPFPGRLKDGFGGVVWPGRFQRIGNTIVDGAHNPPAARALAQALGERGGKKVAMIAGFCSDKDVRETLSILAPLARKAYAVATNNPRSVSAADLARMMRECSIDAEACGSLAEALKLSGADSASASGDEVLVCGSLFLAGEALVALGAYPWGNARFDPSELLRSPRSGGKDPEGV